MFNIGNEKISVSCTCGKKHSVMLQDAAKKKIIRCFCGINIQLNDNKDSVKNGISDINKALNDLDRAFKSLGKR